MNFQLWMLKKWGLVSYSPIHKGKTQGNSKFLLFLHLASSFKATLQHKKNVAHLAEELAFNLVVHVS